MNALGRHYCGLLHRMHTTSSSIIAVSPLSHVICASTTTNATPPTTKRPNHIQQRHHHNSHNSAATMLLLHCCRRSIHLAANHGLRASHYDVLGITPNATQSDIKSAYYRLSMIYHPDKSAGSAESVAKFRTITAAYEVLSNYRLRKMYDKGIGGSTPAFARSAYGHQAPADPTVADVDDEDDADAQSRFYKRHMMRTKPPPASGRTPIYNFDEWSAAHYGSTRERRLDAQTKYRTKQQQKREDREGMQTETVVFGVLFGVAVLFYVSILVSSDEDVDRVKVAPAPIVKKAS